MTDNNITLRMPTAGFCEHGEINGHCSECQGEAERDALRGAHVAAMQDIDDLKRENATLRAQLAPKQKGATYIEIPPEVIAGDPFRHLSPDVRPPKACRWVEDASDGSWDAECGGKHQFEVDGPDENQYHFCPYCGGRLVV